jgi:hypothetical protein
MSGDNFYVFAENCVVITIIYWISKVRANKNSLWITAITENQRLFATGNLTDNAHLTNMLHMNTIIIWGPKEEECSFPKKFLGHAILHSWGQPVCHTTFTSTWCFQWIDCFASEYAFSQFWDKLKAFKLVGKVIRNFSL